MLKACVKTLAGSNTDCGAVREVGYFSDSPRTKVRCIFLQFLAKMCENTYKKEGVLLNEVELRSS